MSPPCALRMLRAVRRHWLAVALLGSGCAQVLSSCARSASNGESPAPPPPRDRDAFRTQRPRPGPTASVVYPRTNTAQTSHGFAVLWVARPTTTQSLRVTCRVGADDAPSGKAGLPALMARMMTEGTEEVDSPAFAVAVEDLGSSMDHDVSRDELSLGLEVLPGDLTPALKLLFDALSAPAFHASDFQRVQREWLDDLRLARQDPQALAWSLALREFLGPDWGFPEAGTPAQVAELRATDLVEFHAQHIRPSNCALLSVGPAALGPLLTAIAPHLEHWQERQVRNPPMPLVAAPKGQAQPLSRGAGLSTRIVLLDRPAAVQSAIVMLHPLPGRDSPHYEPLRVISNLFGGLFTSRLNTNLREQHAYSYGAYSHILATRRWGALTISTNVERAVTSPALQQLLLEIRRLQSERPSAPELRRSIADLGLKPIAQLGHNDDLLDNLEQEFAFNLGPEYYAGLRDTLRGLSPERLDEATRLISGGPWTIALVADASVSEQLTDKVLEVLATASYTRVGVEWLD